MEILDIINENDEVIGSAPREKIYEKKLRHRIVHVIVRNDDGEMALQLRSHTVCFRPNHWVTTASGHVQSGESYEQAAIRETEEEVHIAPTITLLAKRDYVTEDHQIPKNLAIFTARYNYPIQGDPNDIAKIQFFSLKEIQEMLNRGEKFHPELLFILKEFYNIS